MKRAGVIAGGNWIVDQIKLIDRWPDQDTLAGISEEMRGNGGSPYNLLINLAKLGARFPLECVGLIGDDEYVGHEDPAFMAAQMLPTFAFLDKAFGR
jgi:hypothetical protein